MGGEEFVKGSSGSTIDCVTIDCVKRRSGEKGFSLHFWRENGLHKERGGGRKKEIAAQKGSKGLVLLRG